MNLFRALLVIAGLLLLFSVAGASETPETAFSGTPASGTFTFTVYFSGATDGSPAGGFLLSRNQIPTQRWTEQNAGAGWSERIGHSSVAMPDGSIILTGGYDTRSRNDTWRSVDNGVTWALVNASSGWPARYYHTSVALPDYSIVLMSGRDDSGTYRNDTWRSTDYGKAWTLLNAGSGWPARVGPASVALPDGSIVLMGSWDGKSALNDTWRSTDRGVTWMQQNGSSGWPGRKGHSCAALPDGSIVLMGGRESTNSQSGSNLNDTWKSTDNGVTWTLVNASSGWTGRAYHTSVALPDGSILLMGGWDGTVFGNLSFRNDTWRSTDHGETWTLQNAGSGWLKRIDHHSVALPDGSVVLTGGWGDGGSYRNDTWRLPPAGSSIRGPVGIFFSR